MSTPPATRTERDAIFLPIWNTKQHAETTKVRIPADKLDKTVNCVTVHAARAAMEDIKTGAVTVVAHFRLYLQLDGGKSSVVLNSSGEDFDDGRTKLELIYYKYPFLNLAEQAQSAHDHNIVTAYRLDLESGSGCRHWCEVVLRDFEGYGWVDAEAAATVDHLTSLIKEEHPDVDVPTPAPRGQFY
ncbi:hypothetical protein CPB85DRAFT_1431962 [Mucidula mucida]|nr:hypothetical protein CPB85DRAFT_1431962 [Mucidula mucida]